jgi:hypothetical protein
MLEHKNFAKTGFCLEARCKNEISLVANSSTKSCPTKTTSRNWQGAFLAQGPNELPEEQFS